MYQGWRFARWETPVSDLKSIAMVSLVDDGSLSVTLEDLRDSARSRWRFTFDRAPIYRNIQEEFRLELWRTVHEGGARHGWTVTVPESPWLAALQANEPLIEVHSPGLVHYQIATEDDVIDILSASPPEIAAIEPAGVRDPVPGKSRILHADKDADEVEALLSRVKRGHDDA